MSVISLSLSPLQAAQRFLARGWSVVPVPFRGKNPGLPNWPQLRIQEAELPKWFSGQPHNIGVLLGEPSGWLIDVDLDHPRALALADDYLPATPLVFGRAGKPRSHRLYRALAPTATKKFGSKSAGMIVELRSTGVQTVVPPSTHEIGEAIAWIDETAEPADVDPEELHDAVRNLANTVLVELGERARPKTKIAAPSAPASSSSPPPQPGIELSPDERRQRCLEAMLRMNMTDHRDGSLRLFAAACRVVEHDLDDAAGLHVIAEYVRARPFPQAWSDADVLRRIRDAEAVCERGAALGAESGGGGLVPLGSCDPATGRLVLSPRRTLPTAQAYVRQFHAHQDGRTLQSYAGLLWAWRRNRYVEVEDESLRQQLQPWLHEALRYHRNSRTGELTLVDFESNPATVNAVLDTVRAFTHLPANATAPFWLRDAESRPNALEILPCRSILLHLPTLRR